MRARLDDRLRSELEALCPEVDPGTIEDFQRMDEDYFSLYTPEEIAAHIRMASGLNSERPVRAEIKSLDGETFAITVVGYDYFSELSILCGLLASFGLDIQAGHIHTFSRPPTSRTDAAPARRGRRVRPGGEAARKMKIVDVFRVRPVAGTRFDPPRQRQFEEELLCLVRLLGEGRIEEARDRLGRRFSEFLETAKGRSLGVLFPVEVRFHDQAAGDWTVMDVHGKDTPGFLYALSNALAVRGIYIHKVEIRSIGGDVADRFHISDRWGQRIEGQRERADLRMAVALIKQFTHFLPGAPDPARAMRYFDQFLDKLMESREAGRALSFFTEEEGMSTLARLLGSSRFLWEDFLRMQFESLLPLLEHLRGLRLRDQQTLRRDIAAAVAAARTPDREKKALNDFKDREMFLIDMKHLLDPAVDLAEFSRALTDLADAVLAEGLSCLQRRFRQQYGPPLTEDGVECPLALFGLGKFGGGEMGYGSDIELIFVYGGPGRTAGPKSLDNGDYFERLARELVELIEARQEGIFHVDLRLRPYGRAGDLAAPLPALEAYYRPGGDAAPFERQALVKLRWVAGDEALGRRVEALRDRFVYSGEAWDLVEAAHLRGRQARELVPPRTVNVKYSPGGVVDIEYAAQYLQILHGREHPVLRSPTTLVALDRLRQLGILGAEEHRELREAYLFLRGLVDGLRMVRGNAKDLVLPPATSDEFKFLARRLGYGEGGWEQAAARLGAEIELHMGRVRRIFRARFLPPQSPEVRLWA